MSTLKPEEFFDLEMVSFKDLFEVNKVYQVLGTTLKKYILKNLKQEINGTVKRGAFLADKMIFIGKGTVVEPGAYIKGPTIIGENCEIRQGAYIRGNVIVGDNCVVGHATEIKGSIMLNGAKAGHFNYIGDSILGNHVNLGAGTKLANLKIFNDEISVTAEGYSYATGLRKLGAIMGDNVETGCNSVTAPGTIIGKNSRIYSNISVSGFIRENHIVKNRAPIETVKIEKR